MFARTQQFFCLATLRNQQWLNKLGIC